MQRDVQKQITDLEERVYLLCEEISTEQNESLRLGILLEERMPEAVQKFLKSFSDREMSRLATIGMSLGVDDRDGRLRLQGQYDGIAKLGSSFEDIENAINDCTRAIDAKMVEKASIQNKITKLRNKR